MLNGSLQIKNGIYQTVFYIPGKKKPIWRSTGIKAQRGNKRKAEQRMAEILLEFESGLCDKDKTAELLHQGTMQGTTGIDERYCIV